MPVMPPFLERIAKEVLLLDGSMGALLQNRGLPAGYAPDLWNLENPSAIEAVHREYVEAGSDVILTNTFGASRLRLAEYGAEGRLAEINRAAVEIARRAAGNKAYVAGDIGPLGTTLAPFGELPFDDAVAIFAEQARALAHAGADLIVIETMFDLLEVRAALIGARDAAPGLPLVASMTFTTDGLTDTGTDPATAAAALETLADVIAVNCSTGPDAMTAVVETMARTTRKPIGVQPNAGLPVQREGRTVFPLSAEEVAAFGPKFVEAGATLVGGCCGTTPAYIRLLARTIKGRPAAPRAVPGGVKITSRMKTAWIGPGLSFLKIGEKINPTGKKAFAEAIREGRLDMIVAEARKQYEHGAHALDVNVGVPMTPEAENMARAVTAVQNVVDLPLVIDSSNVYALEAGLKVYPGRALVNSVNAEEEKLERVLPLVKRYGASVLGLVSGDDIPEKAVDRLRNAEKILKRALALGIDPEQIVFDVLALPVSAMQDGSRETIETVRLIGRELGAATSAGVSNVSFGLPNRPLIHNTFLALAIGAGLDAGIVNPYDEGMHRAVEGASLFSGRDPGCRRFIEIHQAKAEEQKKPAAEAGTPKSTRDRIFEAVVEGERESIQDLVRQGLAEGLDPFALFLDAMTPGIRRLGDLFGARKKFIPHLIAAAETMRKGVEILSPLMESAGAMEKKGTIVMATVKGDIHDIGKNICCLMLRNYGFAVIDLGKNVPSEAILDAAAKHRADVIGLSALMTTTMMQMKVVRDAVREKGLPCKIMIGGAVTTPEFAREIGVDAHGKDVGDVTAVAERLVEELRGTVNR